jgi:hypothetical protein
MSLSPAWRRAVLFLHVTTSVGCIGAVAAFLSLAIVGAAGGDVYVAMRVMTWTVIVPLAFASLLIGIVSSIGTAWGLVRHYWLTLKLLLTIVAVGVLMLQTPTIDSLAAGRAGPDAGMAMILHSAGGLVVLIAVMVLSIYKPRGLTGLEI